jgi:DNA-binding LacI/PurR family transcriptional regulator
MKRVTIADVAARAGVSISTVSYALSNKRSISDETRQRVQQAIEELNYRPNASAKRLASREVGSRNIGFVLPLIMSEISRLDMKFIAGAANAINQADYNFILLAHSDRNPENLLRFAQSGLVDGFILLEVNMHDARVEALQQEGIPFVLIGRCADNTGIAFVDVDIEQWIEQVLRHLIAQGHRSIACLHKDDKEYGFSVRFLREYTAACERYGIPPLLQSCTLSPEGGETATNALLERHPETTAAIVWSDIPTLGVVQAVQKRGRKIPDDFYIICQEHSIISDLPLFVPSIIDLRVDELTSQAARLMIDLLENKAIEQQQILIPPMLILRSTVDQDNQEQ